MAGGAVRSWEPSTPVYHGGLPLLGVTENMSFVKATSTNTQKLCPQACWESQAHLYKEPNPCRFLRKLTRQSQVGRICDWYSMLGPSMALREATMSVCAPSYMLIHLNDIGMYSKRVNNHKKKKERKSRISMKTGSPTSPS